MKARTGLLALALVTTLGCANNNYYVYEDDSYMRPDRSIQTDSVEHVRVVKVSPVYENIIEKHPYEQCRYVNVPLHSHRNTEVIGSVLGGAAGGVVGHQFGKGRGKTAATIGGAILGTVIGNNMSRHERYPARYEKRRECNTNYRQVSKRVVTGYNNIGYYRGQKIVKFSDRRLRTIPVTVSISY